MNSFLKFNRPPAAGTVLRAGVPFSTRMVFGTKVGRTPVVTGNRAFIRAWAAHRAAGLLPIFRRAK